jgi:hypothetical protein
VLRIGVWRLDVDEQRTSRLEMVAQADERLGVTRPVASKSEIATHENRPVPAWQVKRMHWLDIQVGVQSFACCLVSAHFDDVSRDVESVHIQARPKEGQQQPARPATDIEGGLPESLDRRSEMRDLMGRKSSLNSAHQEAANP